MESPTEGCTLDQQQTRVWKTAPTQGEQVQLTLSSDFVTIGQFDSFQRSWDTGTHPGCGMSGPEM